MVMPAGVGDNLASAGAGGAYFTIVNDLLSALIYQTRDLLT